ncbi:MAG: hypothetical protein PHD81_04600 [Candidatus Nanoarchaeia archaeon]|nr:hypothetical protein [Candidatus Nanoarchaeia archaeon]MDD5588356.1 hypothetical protein [Candidatus Nanoarchaeia archaeon]
MRDPSHEEQIVRWANFVKNNPHKWKAKVKDFMDAQIIMSNNFYKRLLKTPNGKQKLILLRNK